MDIANVHTLPQWIAAMAWAIQNSSMEAVECLDHLRNNWLIDQEEKDALGAMVDAGILAIEAIENAEINYSKDT